MSQLIKLNENQVVKTYNDLDVIFTEDAYVNITPIAKYYKKRPNDYLRLTRTEEYIQALAGKLSSAGNPVDVNSLVITVEGGFSNGNGTWLHPKLVIDFARWLNPEFALWCDEQIENILRVKQVEFQTPTTFAEALRAYADEIESHENTRKLLQDAKDLIEESKPKLRYHDIVLSCPDLLTVTQISQDYSISNQKINKILASKGVQYKDKSGVWCIYAKYGMNQYAQTYTHTYQDNDGNYHSKLHLKWTQKGRLFIYELLKEEGILPICEQEDYYA